MTHFINVSINFFAARVGGSDCLSVTPIENLELRLLVNSQSVLSVNTLLTPICREPAYSEWERSLSTGRYSYVDRLVA
jgi:hypothetical protein